MDQPEMKLTWCWQAFTKTKQPSTEGLEQATFLWTSTTKIEHYTRFKMPAEVGPIIHRIN